MSDDTINARMRSDGTLVRIMPDGGEQPLPIPPSRPMTNEEIAAAARADPDAQPLTAAQLAAVRPVPRVKTLRWALRMTQEEFAARFHPPSPRCAIGSKGVPSPIRRPAPTWR